MAPPRIEPKERRRRAIPRRATTLEVWERTDAEQRAIRAQMRRVERLLHNTRRAADSRIIRPIQNEIESLIRQRNEMGTSRFAASGGLARLRRATHILEQEEQRIHREYIRPISNYGYFWEGQYHGNLPPRPPPPPPPGGGYINITNRLLS